MPQDSREPEVPAESVRTPPSSPGGGFRRCAVCGTELKGREDRRTCSPACRRERSRRQAAVRQEARLREVVAWFDRVVAEGLALLACWAGLGGGA